jgi:phosphopentomutase
MRRGASAKRQAHLLHIGGFQVLRIAAHEEAFGLRRLYGVRRVARRLSPSPEDRAGDCAFPLLSARGAMVFRARRTARISPCRRQRAPCWNRAAAASRAVVGIGEIGDILRPSRDGARDRAGSGNLDLFDKTLAALADLPDGGFIFANYCRSRYRIWPSPRCGGLCGRAGSLRRAPAGPDRGAAGRAIWPAPPPTTATTPPGRAADHAREHVPILAFGPGIASWPHRNGAESLPAISAKPSPPI